MIQEVCPGDTWSGKTGILLRFSPLKRALLQSFYIDQFTFYVPHRLTMFNWEDFIAQGPMESPNHFIPFIDVNADTTDLDLIFQRSRKAPAVGTITYSALRLHAYNLIYNEYFR